nr:MAG TPA: hypothetical protein [Caudoviricetes sp.]
MKNVKKKRGEISLAPSAHRIWVELCKILLILYEFHHVLILVAQHIQGHAEPVYS